MSFHVMKLKQIKHVAWLKLDWTVVKGPRRSDCSRQQVKSISYFQRVLKST